MWAAAWLHHSTTVYLHKIIFLIFKYILQIWAIFFFDGHYLIHDYLQYNIVVFFYIL